MSDEVKFKCERCSGLFDPDPDMVCEAGLVTEEDYEKFHGEGSEWRNPDDIPVTEGACFLCEKCLNKIVEENT